MNFKNIKTIVFPVGGLGTRFLPATKAIPKEMLPVAEKPLIQYAFEEAKDAGIEKFIFVTGRNKTSIEDHFDSAFELEKTLSDRNKTELFEKVAGWMPEAGQIVFLRQQKPLGLGHAVLCAERCVGSEPFAVCLADDMNYSRGGNYLLDMINLAGEKEANVLGLKEVSRDEVSKYGIVDIEKYEGDLLKIRGIVEKPQKDVAPSNFASVGKYVLSPNIFRYLRLLKPGAGSEIQLTDGIQLMLKTESCYGLNFRGNRFDCGSVLGYIEANIYHALENAKIADDVKKIIAKFYGEIDNI
ncbi:MAG: UTP--glucose-1-phosphate uridylyltransferase GalU [Rickettsiales bacterium]|jgi:UTP--glucose-1-phosphate uridylyltransferase|nr:UTP--glucose-1-phosphate uridylyltransferase GalU [Rickettsiales bacterium]